MIGWRYRVDILLISTEGATAPSVYAGIVGRSAQAVGQAFRAWNGFGDSGLKGLPPLHDWQALAQRWRARLLTQVDLTTQLLAFVTEPPEKRTEVTTEGGLDVAGQLQVVTLTDAQKRLGVTVAEHPVVYPDAAKDSLGELLGALASIIEVHAETAIGSEAIVAREVPADATPHVRLMRDGQGLVVEIRVSPLGVEGPSVVPGEGAETLVVARGREGVRTQRSFLNETAGVRALLDACPSLAAKVSAEASVGARVQVPTLEDCLALVVELRDIPPVDTVPGQKARLANLGYFGGAIEDETTDPVFEGAVADFQVDHKLEPTGVVDDATKKALVERHGS